MTKFHDEITWSDLKKAYIKYKSYIYYDTTELFQRKKLAEFESMMLSDAGENATEPDCQDIDLMFENGFGELVDWINSFEPGEQPGKYLEEIDLFFLPKNYSKENEVETFVTNQRIKDKYEIDQVIVFADIPVELHLVTVLWIMKFGHKLDAKLDDNCRGNRLLLNKYNKKLVEGSGLFKPYFKQYQQWRDNAVEEAQRKLDSGSSVTFVNLDFKDYYYSARIDFDDIEMAIWEENGYEEGDSKIHEIFKELHRLFTKKLVKTKYPYPTIATRAGNRYVLPIGVTSSYVLANYHLLEFDRRIKNLIPHIYYSRYVDDILLVLENPDFNFHNEEECESVKFSFKEYKDSLEVKNKKLSVQQIDDLTKTEKFILEILYPLVELVDYPKYLKTSKNGKKETDIIFEVTCMEDLYFQPNKTLLYYFDSKESTAAIDKLKQDLEKRASEFRDFPDDYREEKSFDNQAYHLIFDGTEGKIGTLKDYKENRYGLSVFLANSIFIALRRSKKVTKDESEKILNLFKGMNNLEYFRLWEKIFTFFLVNEDQEGFASFFNHTFTEIKKLNINGDRIIRKSNITQNQVTKSLLKYFDSAFNMAMSLNPYFIQTEEKRFREFEKKKSNVSLEIYLSKNLSDKRMYNPIVLPFINSNLIRHHYVANPLINFTKAARTSILNLVDRSLPQTTKDRTALFDFSETRLSISPRRVKFWECCIARFTSKLYQQSSTTRHKAPDDATSGKNTDKPNEKIKKHILDEASEMYEKINSVHFSSDYRKPEDFFTRHSKDVLGPHDERKIILDEWHIRNDAPFKKNPKVSIANIHVSLKNIEDSIKGQYDLSKERYDTFASLLKDSRIEKADLLILPENSVPHEFVPSLARYSARNQMAVIAGLQHWNVNGLVYNYIVSIVPVYINGIMDAVVLYRLKNHYSYGEELLIKGYGYQIPKRSEYRYDIINWKNLYFTSFYCFEMADAYHRSIFRAKVDLLIASEWNRDIPYFSNIVEALSRDLHCYIAQVNTSHYGDSRLTQPTESVRKDILKLKGGINDTILVGELNVKLLREFQLKYYERTIADGDITFKPVPPDWNRDLVNKRINNEFLFQKSDKDF